MKGAYISIILVGLISIPIIRIFKRNVNNDIDTYNYRVSQFEDIDDMIGNKLPEMFLDLLQ